MKTSLETILGQHSDSQFLVCIVHMRSYSACRKVRALNSGTVVAAGMTPNSLEAPLEPESDAGLVKSFLALTAGSFPVTAETDTPHESTGTSFTPEIVEELERNHPGVLVWLRSTYGVVCQCLLICAYVSFETLAALLNSFVLNPDPPPKFKPLPSSMIVMNSGMSLILGVWISTGISAFSERTSLVRAIPKTCGAIFHWRSILSFSLPGALFSISAVFAMLAYSRIDAGLKKILDQLRLPLTAALSSVILGKKYCLLEWLALLIVLLAVCSFYVAQVEHDKVTELHTKCRYPPHCFSEPSYDICALRVDGSTILGAAIKDRVGINGTRHDISTFPVKVAKTEWKGLVFSLMTTLFNCLGSLFSERILKSTSSTPFATQKVREETTGFPVAIAMSFIVPLWIDSRGGKALWWTDSYGEGFFQGFSALTSVAIVLDMTLSWMGGIIVKHFSSLVKLIAKCFVLLLTVFCSGTFLKACQADPLPMTMYSLAFVIISATLLFATMPKDRTDRATPASVPPAALARESHIANVLPSNTVIQLQNGSRVIQMTR